MSKLLVVDDEESICWGLARLGESLGHEVVAAASAEQAFDEVERRAPDVIVLDVRLPGMDGLKAIERFQHSLGSVPIIVITAYGDLATAVEAVRRGAFDYIAKPFDLQKVKDALVRALVSDRDELPAAVVPTQVEGMVGRSAAMQEAYKQIALAASSDASVLLGGESGTGKELAARAIHRYSRRAGGPFVAVSVAALNPSLAESELFGHARGAFTGAEEDRVGLLVQANGGTLFLDEVAEIPLPTQVKLLRALEHNEVVPVGSNQLVKSDFRVISATHQNLRQRTEQGQFRHDLLFRLGAFQIELPPLGERPDDIEDLANYFISLLSSDGTTRPVRLAAQTLAELRRRRWYGNVRELRNAIEHALILARGRTIMPEHLPPSMSLAPLMDATSRTNDQVTTAIRRWAERNLDDSALAGRVYEQLLEVIEPPLLEIALKRNRGQCATAARTLGIHRTTLRKKLVQYGVSDESSSDQI
ncbi:MAG TPA: sigma-54 dependent transcriptional regulator [Lacipirellulaceae bacterium]